ncbi:polysaccharide biosynthesis tyrosine autokinase [Salegentibacter sp. F188]|uniref:non-specific protein-tyrosine kinase n=1 Tax=Autumnicola patrickiae TaxID=3075591 RepID=A0ABU3E1G7_9FLAO|nr:polysaccharide biosynthesis tyrosine autokinase [Salegentibacter sp. F188]MDT0689843.1 polysaccharide biosynthesis tyrosine autokinase [Salegentibacter sp. F188]
MEELQDFNIDQEESTFDLKAELYKYLSYWKWLLFGVFLGLLLAYLYNRYTIPKFHTEASMMIVDEEKKNMANALPSGGAVFAYDEGMENQIVALKSKSLVEGVVNELDHNISYFIEGNIITVEAYKTSPVVINFITPDSIVHKISRNFFVVPQSGGRFKLEDYDGKSYGSYQLGEVITLNELSFTLSLRNGHSINNFLQSNSVNIKITPLRQVANDYIAGLIIGQKGKAKDILSLSFTQESSRKSEDFLNTLMIHFNRRGVENKREVAENTTSFIQNRLELITEELDSVEGGMASFKRENEIMDVSSGAGEFQSRVSSVEEEIFNLETQIELIASIRERLIEEQEYSLLPSGLGISEAGISTQIGAYNALVLERNDFLQNSTLQNPVITRITRQLDSIEKNLFENIESTIQSINVRIRELSSRGETARGEFSTFPGLEQGMRGIERQQQIKEQLYLFLLQRREEAAISFASTSSVARVIDPAFTNNEPVDPKPWLILVGGFLIGFLIPILIIFIKNILDTKVHHKGDLQPLLKHVPFIGEVPRIAAGQSDIIEVNDRSPLAESFRILRTNMAYLIQKKDSERGEVIFVTSTIKGEGKTFISYNLARTFASTKKKVLIIGADIRNPKLHRYTQNLISEKGLSDYLYNYDISESDLIVSSQEEGIKVDIILSGSIPPNPAELFMNDRMKKLLDFAVYEYDYVIVDTAPTMIVTDTLLISPLADTTVYVTRAEHTEKKLLDFPKELKQQGKLKGLAVILNDVDYSKFSYGAQYGYSYGYGYGYGQDEDSSKLKRIFKNPFK